MSTPVGEVDAALDPLPARFRELWNALAPVGRDASTGGYRRFAWTAADAACRAWFVEQARGRGLDVETDRDGNLWAWWSPPGCAGERAVLTGSHLDSVPDGGGYDGPLGVVSALLAVDELRSRAALLRRPVAVVVFADEEGARFGVACAGSRLLVGDLPPQRARDLTDPGGTTMAQALQAAGLDPARLGPDPERLSRVAAFVELHVEQGRHLEDVGRAVGVATSIAPHGRWHLTFRGAANHAGTTRLQDRRDPVLPLARAVLAAREAAEAAGGVATVGRVVVEPNATNAVASTAHAWLDCRCPQERLVHEVVEHVARAARDAGEEHGVDVDVELESWSPPVRFDEGLSRRVAALLDDAPVLPTGAGHDAGVLAPHVPTTMLFVRNPDGVSHAPGESAREEDCIAGVRALAAVVEELACR